MRALARAFLIVWLDIFKPISAKKVLIKPNIFTGVNK